MDEANAIECGELSLANLFENPTESMNRISAFKLSFSPPEEYYAAKVKNQQKIKLFKLNVDFVKEIENSNKA